jgi:hypothetical protein
MIRDRGKAEIVVEHMPGNIAFDLFVQPPPLFRRWKKAAMSWATIRPPLQLILREILITNSTDSMMTSVVGGDRMPVGETIKYATIIVSTIPVLILYPFLQKYFVKGVMIGAIKG